MRKSCACKFIFILTLYFCGIINVSAQKKFNFTITFTGPSFNTNNLRINFYKGYSTEPIQLKSFNKIVESRTSDLKYPVLEFFYSSSKHISTTIYRFFLIKDVSHIRINYEPDNDDLIIEKSDGVLNFKEAGKEKFDKYAKNELSGIEILTKKYNNDFTNLDVATYNQFSSLMVALRDKGISFIKANPKSLYSLWFFMNEILGKPNYSFEFLNTLYTKYLQPNFKYTFENKYISEQLNKNRLGINTIIPFQDKSFEDISGKTHTLKDFRGKPLIIMLWATWCVPCVAEIPALKQLYLKFEDRLGFISFSMDDNEKEYKNFMEKNTIDWINVYGRYDFCKVYGSDKGIPQVYLIDKNGAIVYSRSIFKDNGLDKLSTIIEQILVKSSLEKEVSK